MRKRYLIILLFCLGCKNSKFRSLDVAVINNDSTLMINGLDSLILNDIARDTANRFDGLAPVYKMPADTDMKDYQKAQPGKYLVKNGDLLFTPDTAFIEGQTYFVRYYQYRTQNTIWDFLSGRKSARGVKHNDLIFKP